MVLEVNMPLVARRRTEKRTEGQEALAARKKRDCGAFDWVVSWALGEGRELLIHRYYFRARDEEEALEKALAWTRKEVCPLPRHTRFTRREMFLIDQEYYPLLFWHIFWLEEGEKHDLLIFHTKDRATTRREACQWASTRHEFVEQRQVLRRLYGEQSAEARFDSEEGELLFVGKNHFKRFVARNGALNFPFLATKRWISSRDLHPWERLRR